jgi:hypothetical protein
MPREAGEGEMPAASDPGFRGNAPVREDLARFAGD